MTRTLFFVENDVVDGDNESLKVVDNFFSNVWNMSQDTISVTLDNSSRFDWYKLSKMTQSAVPVPKPARFFKLSLERQLQSTSWYEGLMLGGCPLKECLWHAPFNSA